MTATKKRETGDEGENIACLYLERKGFTIIERNYLRPWGEIDIVARKESVYRFVEVKTISREMLESSGHSKSDLTPEDHITAEKIRRLSKTVELYMESVPRETAYQIDFVAVRLDRERRRAICTLYEQIIE